MTTFHNPADRIIPWIRLCDGCGAKAVANKECRPLFEVHGNRIDYLLMNCMRCSTLTDCAKYPIGELK